MNSKKVMTDEPHKSKWQSTVKTITSLLPKLTPDNILSVADELTSLDLVAARGPFCRALIQSQSASPRSTNVYASLASIVNSKFPDVGLLLVKRAVLDFRAAFAAKDRTRMQRGSTLLAHLVNQTVVYEVLAFDVLLLLLGDPTRGNVDVAVRFCMDCGSALMDYSPLRMRGVFSEFRRVLKRGGLEKQEQVAVVRLLGAVRKSGFGRYPSIAQGLDLVEVGDQVTHEVSLLHVDVGDPETSLDEFREGDEGCDEVTSILGRVEKLMMMMSW